MKRNLFALLSLMLLLVSCKQAASSDEREELTPEPPQTVATFVPQAGPVEGKIVLAEGQLVAVNPALVLAFETDGRLLALDVQPGDRVDAGDVVATLDDTALQEALTSATLQVAQSENSLAQQQLALDGLLARQENESTSARVQLAQAEQAVDDAQEAYDKAWDEARDWELQYGERMCYPGEGELIPCSGPKWSERLESEREATSRGLQAAQDNLAVAQASFDVTVAGLGSDIAATRLRVEQASLSLEQSTFAQQQAESALARAQLVAQGNGMVLSVDVAVGALVGPGTPIVTLLDTDRLEFHTTNLSERDLAQVFPGQAAVVTLKAYPNEPIEAEVVRIGLQAGPPVGDAATFPVMLVLSETDLDVRPGMTGRVEIHCASE